VDGQHGTFFHILQGGRNGDSQIRLIARGVDVTESFGVAGRSQYAPSKAALDGMALLAIERASRQLIVNVAPRPADTPMLVDPPRSATPPKLPALGRVRPARAGCRPGGISPRSARMLNHHPAARHLRGSVSMTETASTAPPRVLGLVADDLTGAADSAVGFAEHGWRVELVLRSAPPRMLNLSIATVLALTTESRALPGTDAAQQTFTAANQLITAGAERLYIKIDSTVRGSVAAQVDGAIRAWSTAHDNTIAVVCPAFPDLGRTVVDGVVLIDGVPVGDTAAGIDPVTPRTESDLLRIIPGSARGTLDTIGSARIVVVDARTTSDLDMLAARLAWADRSVIMVGSGGLSAALGRLWSVEPVSPATWLPRRAASGVLVAVSSLHPVTRQQVAQLREQPSDQVTIMTATQAVNVSAAEAAVELADRVAPELTTGDYLAAVLVGGDGAAAILRRLAADRVVVDSMISTGCPTGTVAGGPADGLRLVTKSGGFGRPDTLTKIVDRLRRDVDTQP
jgi:D-threonate/D-erythronate kinase